VAILAVPVAVGDSVSFTKTVSETDVYLFAGISGDFSPNHVDEQYMKSSPFGKRVAHGALSVAFMSSASAKMTRVSQDLYGAAAPTPMALGFDRLRFLKPVFFGDTLTTTYTVEAIDESRTIPRSIARIEVRNQHGELTAVAQHINAWVPPETTVAASGRSGA
jgi:Acyl dehydratase